ncbi:MAG: permease, partial [Verrucomicrobiota bacterium]
ASRARRRVAAHFGTDWRRTRWRGPGERPRRRPRSCWIIWVRRCGPDENGNGCADNIPVLAYALTMWNWAEWIADQVLRAAGLAVESRAGAALHFFVYDLLKITVLILGVAFVMGLVRAALPMERLRAWLERSPVRWLGYPAAAAFGALTPFCSCSSVPLFLGFVKARFPIGVAFAFLITSPLVNEIAVVLIGVSFGWKVAAGYAVAGIAMGIVGGAVLSALRAERWLAAGALDKPLDEDDDEPVPDTWSGRIRDAAETSGFIYKKIFVYLLAALALGAGLHGFVPEGFFEKLLAGTGAWSVPLAALGGLPLYVSANATVPLLDAFVAKGVPLGTAMAFILSAVGVSLPELTLLRGLMSVRLLAIFSGVVLVGTTIIGWVFNAVT